MSDPNERFSPPRPPTIVEVAAAAGVAASTVSRSFTKPERVNASTREHVLAVARDLGYHGASPTARALLRGRTDTLGIVVPDITNPHFSRIVRGAAARASLAEHAVLLADSDESPAAELQHIHRLAKATDGLLLVASRLEDDAITQLARNHRIVLVNRVSPVASSVLVNQQSSMYEVIEHLVGLGHRQIGYAAGPAHSWVAEQRLVHLANAADRRRVVLRRLGTYEPFFEAGPVVARDVIASKATAVVVHNAVMALGLISALQQGGVRVPEDVSVLGLDDVASAAYVSPTLTAQHASQETVGDAAAALLLAALDEPEAAKRVRQIIPARLIVRESTGPSPNPPKP